MTTKSGIEFTITTASAEVLYVLFILNSPLSEQREDGDASNLHHVFFFESSIKKVKNKKYIDDENSSLLINSILVRNKALSP